MREKLIELNHASVREFFKPGSAVVDYEEFHADFLIANGVTIATDNPEIHIISKALTNGDRIRAMSDEELAKIIAVFVSYPRCVNPKCGNCDLCPLTDICDIKEGEELDWLRKPVKEVENGDE